MKTLPFEGHSQKQKPLSNNRQHSKKQTDTKTAKYRIEIKKISQRLKAYADGANVSDTEVVGLLEETRRQVVQMRVARQTLKNSHKPKSPRHRH